RANTNGAIDEQLQGLERGDRGGRVDLAGFWQRQRWHAIALLTGDAQRFPTARQDREVRASPHKGISEQRACIEQVLAVIEQKQEPLVPEMFGECRRDRLLRLFFEPEDLRRGPRHEAGLGERCELDQPCAIRKTLEGIGGKLQAQARLATTASTGKREQPGSGEQSLQFPQFSITSDKSRCLLGQVVRRGLQRAQRRKILS